MAEIVTFQQQPRRTAEALPARLKDVMLISLFREQSCLHPFIKALFQRCILTVGDLPSHYDALPDEFVLDPVITRLFVERVRTLTRTHTGAGQVVKFEPR